MVYLSNGCQYSLKSEVSKPQPTGQIQPSESLYPAHGEPLVPYEFPALLTLLAWAALSNLWLHAEGVVTASEASPALRMLKIVIS